MATIRQHPNFLKFRMKTGILPDFSGANKKNQEIPGGIQNGINRKFTVTSKPIIFESETVIKDGMIMSRNLDYTVDLVNGAITFSTDQVPQTKSVIRVSYSYAK